MKLTFVELLDGVNSVQELMTARPAPTAVIAYKIARNARQLNKALEDFSSTRDRIRQEYLDDSGEIPEDKREAFDAEIGELLQQEVEVDIRTITEQELAHCSERRPEFGVAPGVIFGAGFMFDFGETADPGCDGYESVGSSSQSSGASSA